MSSAAPEAIELAESAGLVCDPWQEFVLDGSLAETNQGKWSAFEVGLVVARQNGKGSILEVRELAGLFLFEEELIIHSAHEFATSFEALLRIKTLIENAPHLERKVKSILTANGKESVNLKPSKTIILGSSATDVREGRKPRLLFKARSGNSVRGFTGDCIILDEAYRLPQRVISAMMPTMSAKSIEGNPQIWYTSSAVNQEEHEHGAVLARVRQRGIRGNDPSLAYFEWSVSEDVYADNPRQASLDPRNWAIANPGMGIRISAEHIGREQRSMAAKSFAVERLSVGDWPDVDEFGDDGPIKRAQWAVLHDPNSQAGPEITVGIEVSLGRERTTLAVYGPREDGLGHCEIIDRFSGTGGAVQRLLDLRDKWGPLAFAIDGKGPALSLVTEIEEAGIRRAKSPDKAKRGDLLVLSVQDMAAACGQLLDAVDQRTIRHLGGRWQNDLDLSVTGLQTRTVGDLEVWGRRNATSDIGPITAITVARWGHLMQTQTLKRIQRTPLAAWR